MTDAQAVVRAVLLGSTEGIMRLLNDRILYSEIVNGESYKITRLRRSVLIPQQRIAILL